jgi:protein ImuB
LIAIARLQTAGLVHAAPNDLPLAALAAARPHLATLQRIGCTHWGQLRALPRGGVARRFGAPLIRTYTNLNITYQTCSKWQIW